ncbi:MAG: nucleoside 2-deoxyribosyltransferase, partial [Candidatus Symbiothrix sp.]|nr:nucleoside 2-deoxyribosyltransferase [Candidatus Symbiothrix sp.]
MMEQLYLEIGRADLIIADMSYVDANVTYEVGYAHGINKEIILLSNDVKTIPFNLKYYQHIIFNKNDLAGLQNKLRTALKAYVEKITSSPGHEQIDSIASSEAKPFSLHAWNSWGGIRVFSCENEIVLRGDAETSGYVNDHLGRDLAGKTLILYITNTKDSNFSMNRLVKMTVNQDDKLLVPDKK